MPNAKCDKCKQELDNICIDDEKKILLIQLLEERAKRSFGIIYNIDPGIRHNEISPTNTSLNGNNCDGIIWYNHFSKNPEGFEDIDLSKIIFNSEDTDKIKKNLLQNIHNKQNNEQKINETVVDKNNCDKILNNTEINKDIDILNNDYNKLSQDINETIGNCRNIFLYIIFIILILFYYSLLFIKNI